MDEDTSPAPVTAYARAKLDAEVALAAFADDLTVTCLRLGTVYGWAPRLRADLVVNNLVGWAVTTGEVVLRSDGTSWRPLVHVDMLDAAERDDDVPVVPHALHRAQLVLAHAIAARTIAPPRQHTRLHDPEDERGDPQHIRPVVQDEIGHDGPRHYDEPPQETLHHEHTLEARVEPRQFLVTVHRFAD